MNNDRSNSLACRIKDYRKRLGYTQEQFAELIELSVSSYTKIENSFQKPSLDTLIKISEKMNISMDYLLFGREKALEPDAWDVLNSIILFADKDALIQVRNILNIIINIKGE